MTMAVLVAVGVRVGVPLGPASVGVSVIKRNP